MFALTVTAATAAAAAVAAAATTAGAAAAATAKERAPRVRAAGGELVEDLFDDFLVSLEVGARALEGDLHVKLRADKRPSLRTAARKSAILEKAAPETRQTTKT